MTRRPPSLTADRPVPTMGASAAGLRIDKWLWYARFCKSRSLASALCTAGGIRLNGASVTKAHALVRPGDVVVIARPQGLPMTVRVLALGDRRGSAVEAGSLYQRLDQPQVSDHVVGPV